METTIKPKFANSFGMAKIEDKFQLVFVDKDKDVMLVSQLSNPDNGEVDIQELDKYPMLVFNKPEHHDIVVKTKAKCLDNETFVDIFEYEMKQLPVVIDIIPSDNNEYMVVFNGLKHPITVKIVIKNDNVFMYWKLGMPIRPSVAIIKALANMYSVFGEVVFNKKK